MTTIYTFGYTGSSHAVLEAHLQNTGALLVDIRMSRRSRNHAWREAALWEVFDHSWYLPLSALGNVNYRNGGPIALYEPADGLAQLRPILARRPVILLCACADYQTCHRLTAALYLQAHLGGEVVHLPATAPDPLAAPKDRPAPLTRLGSPYSATGEQGDPTQGDGAGYRGPEKSAEARIVERGGKTPLRQARGQDGGYRAVGEGGK